MTRVYQKIVYPTLKGLSLDVDVISKNQDREHVLYAIPLGQLLASEQKLQDGRFLLYVDDTQEHVVRSSLPMLDESVVEFFQQRLTWIGENAEESWSFTLEIPSLGINEPCYIIWSFKKLSDALKFKLTF